MKKTLLLIAILASAIATSCTKNNEFELSRAAIISDSREVQAVAETAQYLRKDIIDITGKPAPEKQKYRILIGTIGHSYFIDGLVEQGYLDVSEIKGQSGQYIIQKIDKHNLAIAGSDVRGLAFATMHIGEMMGINKFDPNAPIQKKKKVYIDGTRYVSNPASNKYYDLVKPDDRIAR